MTNGELDRLLDAAEPAMRAAIDEGIRPLVERLRDLREENARLKKIHEFDRHAIDRWLPCPGHRDKTKAGVCLMCALERVEAALERARDACADPEIGKMVAFALKVASQALGRLHAQGIVTEGGDVSAAPGGAQRRVEPGRSGSDAP